MEAWLLATDQVVQVLELPEIPDYSTLQRPCKKLRMKDFDRYFCSFINLTTSSWLGLLSTPGKLMHTIAATAEAYRMVSTSPHPYNRPYTIPARKESPAPALSITWMVYGFISFTGSHLRP